MSSYQITSPIARYSPADGQWWLCPQSGVALDAKYQDKSLLLPLAQKPTLTLGEGNTPLLKLKKLSSQLDIQLWAKCEATNPTGSFKDRGSVVEITKALELGKKGVVCASTGNMAASLAAYAAAAGLTCRVIIPESTPRSKLLQALACGAVLQKVAGTYSDCVSVAEKYAQENDFFLCGDYLLRREGQKSVGWELAASELNINSLVVPVGNGTLAVAAMKGLSEKLGPRKLPALIGIQACTVNPLAKAWNTNQPLMPLENTKTIASAFNVGNPLDGYLVLEWLAKTNGQMLEVSDDEIRRAQQLLAKEEGLYVETTAASTLAGIINTKQNFQNQTVVMILTGAGLKEGGDIL